MKHPLASTLITRHVRTCLCHPTSTHNHFHRESPPESGKVAAVKEPVLKASWRDYTTRKPQLPFSSAPSNNTDLRRFLEEVGTNPREARYWLKQFQHSTESCKPFAVVQIEQAVFQDKNTLERLGSCLAFLHRCDMKVVLVHGGPTPTAGTSQEEHQKARQQMTLQSMMLSSLLELHGAPTRPLFVGSNIIQAKGDSLQYVNPEPIKWALQSGHIPVLYSVGETPEGQMVPLDVTTVTAEVSKSLQPLKVMFLNETGGLRDEEQKIVANVNLPADIDSAEGKPWNRPDVKMKVQFITRLLSSLPSQSSVVITSASTILTELFTYHGSGTFFKITEPILVHDSLEEVDRDRLLDLLARSFGREVKHGYMEDLEKRLHTLYVSKSYNAVAIITREPDIDVPYLDKLAVGGVTQGEGTGDLLWEHIRRDFKSLFWRSRGSNMITPWYFKRCEGSWNSGQWTVFWYGLSEHRMSSELIDYALSFPCTFNTHNGASSAASGN